MNNFNNLMTIYIPPSRVDMDSIITLVRTVYPGFNLITHKRQEFIKYELVSVSDSNNKFTIKFENMFRITIYSDTSPNEVAGAYIIIQKELSEGGGKYGIMYRPGDVTKPLGLFLRTAPERGPVNDFDGDKDSVTPLH